MCRDRLSPPVLPTLTTERLVLRPATYDALPAFVELNSDPDVMRHLLGRAGDPASTAQEWKIRLGPQTDLARGLGYWVGLLDGAFVGWWSASRVAADPTVSGIGYRLRHEAWGRGLATEGATAMRDHALGVDCVERLVATTMAVNTGSRRVLEKIGMSHVDTYVGEWDDPLPGWEQGEVVYELRR